MSWSDELIPLATWALQSEDLRHRYMHSDSAAMVLHTPGIAWSIETVAVLAIFEAAIGKGYKWGETVDYERVYPGTKKGANPRRADLAFKAEGQGKNWAYLEMKYYNKQGIQNDIEKLKSIEHRMQRWMLIYRIRAINGRTQSLDKLLEKNYHNELEVYGKNCFNTLTNQWDHGVCELSLCRVN